MLGCIATHGLCGASLATPHRLGRNSCGNAHLELSTDHRVWHFHTFSSSISIHGTSLYLSDVSRASSMFAAIHLARSRWIEPILWKVTHIWDESCESWESSSFAADPTPFSIVSTISMISIFHSWSIHDLLWSTLLYILCSSLLMFLQFSGIFPLGLEESSVKMVVAGAAAAIAAGSVSQARTGHHKKTNYKMMDDIWQHFATSVLEIQGHTWCKSHCCVANINSFVPFFEQAFVASPAPRAAPIQAEALLQSRPGVLPVGWDILGYLTIAVRSYI